MQLENETGSSAETHLAVSPLATHPLMPKVAPGKWRVCPRELKAALEPEKRPSSPADFAPGCSGTSSDLESTRPALPVADPWSADRWSLAEIVNEALERALAELRTSNRELEIARRELRLLNDDLQRLHTETASLAADLNRLGERYLYTLDQMPYGVALIGSDGRIQFWNAAARRLFGLESDAVLGLHLDQIPVHPPLRQALNRKYRAVIERGSSVMLRNQILRINRALHRVNVHFASLNPQASSEGVLVMFVRPPDTARVVDLSDFESLNGEAAS